MNVREAYALISSLDDPYLKLAQAQDAGEPTEPVPLARPLPPPSDFLRTGNVEEDVLGILNSYQSAQMKLRELLSGYTLAQIRELSPMESLRISGEREISAWSNELVLPDELEASINSGMKDCQRLFDQALSDLREYLHSPIS